MATNRMGSRVRQCEFSGVSRSVIGVSRSTRGRSETLRKLRRHWTRGVRRSGTPPSSGRCPASGSCSNTSTRWLRSRRGSTRWRSAPGPRSPRTPTPYASWTASTWRCTRRGGATAARARGRRQPAASSDAETPRPRPRVLRGHLRRRRRRRRPRRQRHLPPIWALRPCRWTWQQSSSWRPQMMTARSLDGVAMALQGFSSED
mmetsp:Transcript_135811/g.378483  ORF Transcript_135811/g.378483 Transcript_135811/m.378483 type:complete len:203 (+) Transcript_135811:484-1092(+)